MCPIFPRYMLISCVLSTTIFVSACAQRTVPAPVIKINTQVEETDRWSGTRTHTVQQGETLYGIAWLYGKDYQEIATINRLIEPYQINTGQKLQLIRNSNNVLVPSADIKITDNVSLKTKSDKHIVNNTSGTKSLPKVKDKPLPKEAKLPTRVSRWVWPAQGTLIGKFSNKEAGLKGIEISNAIGTQILSTAKGKVVYTGDALRGYGNLVIIKHTDNFLSAYAHNDKIIVKERQVVQAGEKIAEMGRSGTTEAKLRFEIRYKGKSLDPLKYLSPQK
jgi:lipoprotein NlpD